LIPKNTIEFLFTNCIPDILRKSICVIKHIKIKPSKSIFVTKHIKIKQSTPLIDQCAKPGSFEWWEIQLVPEQGVCFNELFELQKHDILG